MVNFNPNIALADIDSNEALTEAIQAFTANKRIQDHAGVQEWVDGDYLFPLPFGDQVFPRATAGHAHAPEDYPSLPSLAEVKTDIRETKDDFDDQLTRLIFAAAQLCAQYCFYNFSGKNVVYTGLTGPSGLIRCGPTISPPPFQILVQYGQYTTLPIVVPADRLVAAWPNVGYTLTARWAANHPQADLTEPIVQMVGYLFDQPGASTNARLAGAIANSGAAIHLNRFKRRWT